MPNEISHQSAPAATVVAGVPVSAELSYVTQGYDIPTHYTFEPPEGVPWENVEYEKRSVPISDARARRTSLDEEGFELWEAPSRVNDFGDTLEVKEVYYREMCEVVRRATGGSEVYVFDHLLREREPDRKPLDFGRRTDGGKAAPANGRIHNDYTEKSGINRVKAVLDRLGLPVQKRRYSIINVWRSIGDPVIDTPLALCDGRSVSAMDLVEGRVVYPKRDGWIYVLAPSPFHQWSYFSNMNCDEVILFKQFDTDLSGVSRFTPHSAFENPIDIDMQKPRKSIEMRCLVVY